MGSLSTPNPSVPPDQAAFYATQPIFFFRAHVVPGFGRPRGGPGGARNGPFWGHFGAIFGPFLKDFWVIFGSFLGHFGDTLGSFWGHFGVILGSFWGHSGTFGGHSGRPFRAPGLGAPGGAIWGSFLGHF